MFNINGNKVRTIKIFGAFIISILLVSACASHKKITMEQQLAQRKFDNIIFHTSISPDFPDFKQSFNAKISLAGSDSVSMIATGPFGIAVGRLFAQPNYFLFHNIFENTAFEGTPNKENLYKAARLNLSFEDLIAFLRGIPPGDLQHYKVFDENDKQTVYFLRRDSDFAEFVVISKSNDAMIQYQRKDKNDELEVNINYSDFKIINSQPIASKISFAFPKISGSLNVDISRVEMQNGFASPFSFSVPSSARTINLDTID